MARHHPDLIFCRKQPGIAIGRVCEKCDGKCVICDSFVRPCTIVHICDECNYGSYQGRCVVCGGPGISDAYYCKECTIQEKDRDGCPKIINLGTARTDMFYEHKKYSIQQANELVEKLESNNEQENEEAIIEFKSFLIKNYISYKMFDMLPNIQLKRQGYEEEEQALIEDDKNIIKERLRQNKEYLDSPQKLNLDINKDNDNENNRMDIDEEGQNNSNNINTNEINEENEDNDDVQPFYKREDFEDSNNYNLDDDNEEEEEEDPNNKYLEDAIDKKDKQRDTSNYKQVGNNNKGLNMNLNLLKKIEKQKYESIWDYPTCLGTYDIES